MEFVKNLQSFLQSYNKSLINQARGPYWENIGPRADILPVRSRASLVNKIYIYMNTYWFEIQTLPFKLNTDAWQYSVGAVNVQILPVYERKRKVRVRVRVSITLRWGRC